MTVFNLSYVAFAYDSAPVLRDISATFSSGELVALVGPNGAGKSTLLKIMAGLIRGYRGTVEFSGKALYQYSSRDLAKKIAFVPQETHMVFPFTVNEIVMMGRLPHRSGPVF